MAKFTVVHAIRRSKNNGSQKTSANHARVSDLPTEAANENIETARHAEQAESDVAEPERWYARWAENIARNIGQQHLINLALKRGHVSKSLDEIPKRMHKVANQTRLVLELIDDFVEGRYRTIPWHSLVVLAAAVLYTVSPGDVVPDVFPLLGAMDDLAVLAVATRLMRKDLERYCRFKHYSEQAYFG